MGSVLGEKPMIKWRSKGKKDKLTRRSIGRGFNKLNLMLIECSISLRESKKLIKEH
jgi:hypothetical protein